LYIRPLPDGTNHIIAIELEAEPKPLCMINAYMPCRGRKNTAHQYSESIDIIREMVIALIPSLIWFFNVNR
jgi:hypothetical protein